jgi:hypothetical protein
MKIEEARKRERTVPSTSSFYVSSNQFPSGSAFNSFLHLWSHLPVSSLTLSPNTSFINGQETDEKRGGSTRFDPLVLGLDA